MKPIAVVDEMTYRTRASRTSRGAVVTYARALERGGVEVLIWEPRAEGWYVPVLRRSDAKGLWWSEVHVGGVTATVPHLVTDVALALARRNAW